MHPGVRFAIAVLVGVISCSCSRSEAPPSPPEGPDLAGRTYPRPPGSDDFASGRFSYPLSLSDAEAVLRRTRVFAFGGMPPKRQLQAFNVVFDDRDAKSRFVALAEIDAPAGKLYAFAGLLLLDHAAAEAVRASLARSIEEILVIDSDTSYEKGVRDVADMIQQRDLGRWFRRMRDETNQYFATKDR